MNNFKKFKVIHLEGMNAYNSFCASVDYECEMFTLCRFPNGVTLNHVKRMMIGSKLLCTQDQEVTNVFYHMSLISFGDMFFLVSVEDV